MLRDVMEVVVVVGLLAFVVIFAYSQHKGAESLQRETARQDAARKRAEAKGAQD